MKLIECFHKDKYPHDPIFTLNFSDHLHIMRDGYLFLGDMYSEFFTSGDKYNDKEKIVFTLEEPNFCTDILGPHAKFATGYGADYTGGPIYQSNIADTILTLCPYTVEADQSKKRTLIYFPYNENLILKTFDKVYDVIYSGSLPQLGCWGPLMQEMQKYNYVDIHYRRGNFRSCTHEEKISLYSKTKIALCHNVCPVGPNKPRYLDFPNSQNNEAFRFVDKGILPQIKSRTMEAAFNKCIILCYKDDWNVIERYFVPNEEFLYFENAEQASELIKEILSNYDKYKHIAENAYAKAINNYTVKHFCEKFLT